MIELVLGQLQDGLVPARAVISPRGASLRKLEVGGIDSVWSTTDPTPPMAAGVVLVPWPNRVV